MNMNESLKIPLNALCSYIIKNIKNGNYKVESINFQEYPSDDIAHEMFSYIINYFVFLDDKNNRGKDGNALYWKKININENSYFLLINKLTVLEEKKEKEEKVKDRYHLFYNDDSEFNPMKLSYLGCIIPKNNSDSFSELIKLLEIPM